MEAINVALFGNDPKIQKAVSVARNVAVTKATVLVVGEAGVGKKSLGQFIHENSTRGGEAFFTLDCALDSSQIENKILGYRDEETGRFHKGILELANKGTIILSNVDAIEEGFQRRLHKVLGELDDYEIDIRIISTTSKNLSKLVGSGRFYRGLYTFLSSNTINIPPLRERATDLEFLARSFVKEMAANEMGIEETAMNKILSHYWTHNVQELKTVIASSVTESQEQNLKEEMLAIGEKKTIHMSSDDDSEGIRLMSLKEAEKLLIKKALIHTSENRTQAAKILGVSIRTLRNKINEYRNGGSAYFLNLR